eukprot:Clim_evm43s191 gene=Clim_evmTU43s191
MLGDHQIDSGIGTGPSEPFAMGFMPPPPGSDQIMNQDRDAQLLDLIKRSSLHLPRYIQDAIKAAKYYECITSFHMAVIDDEQCEQAVQQLEEGLSEELPYLKDVWRQEFPDLYQRWSERGKPTKIKFTTPGHRRSLAHFFFNAARLVNASSFGAPNRTGSTGPQQTNSQVTSPAGDSTKNGSSNGDAVPTTNNARGNNGSYHLTASANAAAAAAAMSSAAAAGGPVGPHGYFGGYGAPAAAGLPGGMVNGAHYGTAAAAAGPATRGMRGANGLVGLDGGHPDGGVSHFNFPPLPYGQQRSASDYEAAAAAAAAASDSSAKNRAGNRSDGGRAGPGYAIPGHPDIYNDLNDFYGAAAGRPAVGQHKSKDGRRGSENPSQQDANVPSSAHRRKDSGIDDGQQSTADQPPGMDVHSVDEPTGMKSTRDSASNRLLQGKPNGPASLANETAQSLQHQRRGSTASHTSHYTDSNNGSQADEVLSRKRGRAGAKAPAGQSKMGKTASAKGKRAKDGENNFHMMAADAKPSHIQNKKEGQISKDEVLKMLRESIARWKHRIGNKPETAVEEGLDYDIILEDDTARHYNLFVGIKCRLCDRVCRLSWASNQRPNLGNYTSGHLVRCWPKRGHTAENRATDQIASFASSIHKMAASAAGGHTYNNGVDLYKATDSTGGMRRGDFGEEEGASGSADQWDGIRAGMQNDILMTRY